jgi:uncharacterized membrane protein HdeD (DUF308 family)
MVLEGAVALFLGVLAILAPNEGGIFAAKLLGLYWLLRGGMDLFRLIIDQTWWIWRLFGALIGVTAGLVMLRHPLASSVIDDQRTIFIIAVLGVLYGIVCLVQAVHSKGWGLAVLGLMSGIFGLLLLSEPYLPDLPLIPIIGGFAILGALTSFYAAVRME